MHKCENFLGMSAIISHPEKKSIEEQIEISANIGFDSFFLSCDVTNEFEKIPFWSHFAQKHGICFEAVHAPSSMVNSIWFGDEQAIIYKSSTEKILDLCSEGEVSKLVLHVGTDPDIKPSQTGLEFWKNLEIYAKKRGVKLCYENANTPNLFEAVVSDVDSFHGICLDIGHQLCYTPEKDYLNLFGDKIIYTHIHDNLSDGRDMHLLPKDGKNDWNKFFSGLNEVKYKGTYNLELSCYYSDEYKNMTFYDFVEHSYKRLLETVI